MELTIILKSANRMQEIDFEYLFMNKSVFVCVRVALGLKALTKKKKKL